MNAFRSLRPALVALCAWALATGVQAQNVAINANGAAADPAALLDISSLSKGLLIPRMNALPAPAALPDGLWVYRTGGAVGFYVVDQGVWVRMWGGRNGWDVYGNWLSDPTDPNPDFIGTTDGTQMNFRTNNAHRMRIDGGTGHVGVGFGLNTVSTERLNIAGALSMYYVPIPGQMASATDAPGVLRYQTFGNQLPNNTNYYPRGGNELMATNPLTTAVNNAVLGTGKSYALQHAGHWGNVNGIPLVQGSSAAGVTTRPSTGGWRALENPYEEERGPWTHHREALCTPDTSAELPVGVAGIPSNQAAANIPIDEQRNISPWYMQGGSLNYRRQYLFRAEEVDLELAQSVGTPPAAARGLCRGGLITAISFYAYAANQLRLMSVGGGRLDVTVRNAPAGLNELNGFDNSATDDMTGWGCGTITGNWPLTTGGAWVTVNLIPGFVWDGTSNVLVEVAGRSPIGSGTALRPVRVTDAGFNASYGAFHASPPPATFLPNPDPLSWSCENTDNAVTRFPDNWTTLPPTVYYGGSTWRPVVRFEGEVALPAPGATHPLSGTGYTMTYTGALILEDTVTAVTDIPWGQWRPNFPAGNLFFAYQGNGTISAQHGVYDNTVTLNDHVFDRAFDGRVAPGDAARHGGERLLSIAEMERFTRTHRHLPTMKGRSAWEQEGGFALGDLANQLWATTETQALYVTQLHDKLNVIEMLTNDRPITAAEFRTARAELATLVGYTDAEKSRLIATLRNRLPQAPSR